MSAIETKTEEQRDPDARSDRTGTPARSPNEGTAHFSPDPMEGTDRYRLVTPYLDALRQRKR